MWLAPGCFRPPHAKDCSASVTVLAAASHLVTLADLGPVGLQPESLPLAARVSAEPAPGAVRPVGARVAFAAVGASKPLHRWQATGETIAATLLPDGGGVSAHQSPPGSTQTTRPRQSSRVVLIACALLVASKGRRLPSISTASQG